MGYIIKTRDDFLINGVSALSVGLVVEMPPPPPMAAPRYADYNTCGDFDLVIQDDSFDPINYTITARIIKNPDSFDNSAIYNFLNGAKTLQISRLPGYFYRVQKVTGIQPVAKVKGNEVIYSIGFQLEPFKYLVDDEEITITGHGDVYNNGTRYCRPVYEITLSSLTGNGNLTVNGLVVTISMESVSASKIVIDTEKMMAYAPQSGTNMTMYTSGIYRYLNVGVNTVAVTGFCQSVKIKRNQRCY